MQVKIYLYPFNMYKYICIGNISNNIGFFLLFFFTS